MFGPSIAALSLLATTTLALPSITRTGKYLYDPSGSRFYIKGVAYQPQGELSASSAANAENGNFPEPSSYVDPLSSGANCTRDLPYLQQLGVNALRVYSVNPELNHDDCMRTFNENGIYVLLDVSLPLNGSIDRASPTWSTNLLDAYITTIDKFLAYENVLAFNVGNEVINLPSNTDAAPFVKAAARDVKAYLRSRNSAALVGYSSVDGERDFRDPLAHYLTCGNDTVSLDIYGLNNYEWCGASTYQASGWETIVNDFENLNVAAYMSEYGCITNPPRLWQEVGSLYSQPTTDVFSGGIAFSYFPTSDGYGMVTFSGTDGQQVETSDDFTRLATQLKNITSPPNTPTQGSVQSTQGICPTAENATFQASEVLPPTPNDAVCSCLYEKSFSCVVTPETANKPDIVGALTDYACSLLGASNASASCDPIASNGSTGTYGPLSYCSPSVKLSYIFSAYYEANNRRADACDFSGNATAVRTPPNTAQDASDAANACLAQDPVGGVFTPTGTAPVSTGSATGTASRTGAATGGASAAASSGATSAGVQLYRGFGWVAGSGLVTFGLLLGGTSALML
ncbi:1,3-beta-glucanosyltransferase [Naganishia albida]|nr:1,3-beta-glucanosyltransferase [Naganishia albida]